MARTAWIAGMAFAAGLVACNNASADPLEPLSVHVLVQNQVGVPDETLAKARQEASRIFEALRIQLVWADRLAPQARQIIIKIGSKPPSALWRDPSILGVAAGTKQASGIVAWLFYDRIEALQELFGLDSGLFLGHVMAHEMGHLLLPHGSHRVAGIMKAGWDANQAQLASTRSLTFGQKQAATIRAYLSNRGTASKR